MTTAFGSYVTSTLLKTRANITDTTDDTVLGTICDQINQYIETKTGQVFAPIGSATYLFDGDNDRVIRYKRGIRAVSLLEIAEYTGGAYTTVPSTDYFLRPLNARTGWPYTRIEFTDLPSGTFGWFPLGYATVRVTMTTGWAAIPDDIAEVAAVAAVRAWHAAQSGQTDIIGTDDMGKPLVSRFFSARDLETLKTYSADVGIA